MLNFQYFTPTKVVFGKDAELKVGPLVKEEGCKKVLVHYGGQSAKKSGLLNRVCEALKDFDIDYVTLGGVVPSPYAIALQESITLPPPTARMKSTPSFLHNSIPSYTFERCGFGTTPPSVT